MKVRRQLVLSTDEEQRVNYRQKVRLLSTDITGSADSYRVVQTRNGKFAYLCRFNWRTGKW